MSWVNWAVVEVPQTKSCAPVILPPRSFPTKLDWLPVKPILVNVPLLFEVESIKEVMFPPDGELSPLATPWLKL